MNTSDGGIRRTGIPRPGVLVVDQDRSVRRSLEQALRPQYRVWTSSDADHARKILDRTENIDGVLLDFHLSGRNGLEFGKCLRTLWPRLKIFLMTSLNHALVSKEGIRFGATAFLPKPFSLDTLRLMLASHLLLSQKQIR